jgi:adenine-specific DNA-methyltransferase
MSEQLQQLKSIFHEIFQLDQAELDFGIYRIMRQKREEVDGYLEGQLLNDLRLTAKREYEESSESIQAQINKAKKAAIELGYDPDDTPKVKQLQQELQEMALRESLEDSVLSDLVQFLRRYYKEGDFLSLPRYRKNSYALEYNGEEVKLHWANADQYYVKTAERFRDYRFRLPNGKAVHFKIKAANTETGNNKAENGNERRFQLLENDFMQQENGELLIFFRYAADEQKRKQADINAETIKRILEEGKNFIEWRMELSKTAPTDKNPNRTLLEKSLTDYTARNTFDYFIHKDLNGFLRRELDFYIKNEIVMLDDIENEDAPRVELYLAKVKALRRIGHKLIAFLAQVENFCKKLFLKKKFVVRANYCATLDRVPRDLWTDILANDAQIREWRELCAIDEIEGNLINGNGKKNEEFLEANQNLIVDTRHFPEDWKLKLLESFEDLDANTDGLLIKADNFHALNLLQEKYHEAVKCIYIDPPYNTAVSEIIYKNGYKHSSWLSMLENRLSKAFPMLNEFGIFCVTIDDYELHRLRYLLDNIFSEFNYLATVPIRNNPSGRSTVSGFAINHEYALFFSKNQDKAELGRLPHSEKQKERYSNIDENGMAFEWENFRKSSAGSNRIDRPKQFFPIYLDKDNKKLRIPKLEWQDISNAWLVKDEPTENELVVTPIDDFGNDRVWRFGIERTQNNLEKIDIREKDGKTELYTMKYLRNEGVLPRTWWDKPSYSARDNGTRALVELFGSEKGFDFPKSVEAVKDSIKVSSTDEESIILDFFGGSATTAHAVINLNREDGGTRKYILVETNEYFDSVTLPRVKKVIYSKDWKDGKPVSREGSSHLLKYFALESYEDAMNNLTLNKSDELQQAGLQFTNEFREDYLLNYCLEFETQGSQSLLNLDNFAAPFDYKMKIAVNGVGETQETPVDLVETFYYLIGLSVENMRQIDGFRVVRGKTRTGERCLILWRTTKDIKQELADKRLNDFLEKQAFDFGEIDTLYINGDAAIPVGSVRRETDIWQIKMIEAEFLKRMFE